jgi:hypothetical protein
LQSRLQGCAIKNLAVQFPILNDNRWSLINCRK